MTESILPTTSAAPVPTIYPISAIKIPIGTSASLYAAANIGADATPPFGHPLQTAYSLWMHLPHF